ncbi:MAG TPA: 2,3,4,5-tetrahydropyridine-2,6-carboxylate N-succinyltransferase, partial [Roseibacterium sp.]|nr:2,3,4,5-tetrahydropyridine-2,6-carboxylate N-succinyltransferase [Roseibacterium sp.]
MPATGNELPINENATAMQMANTIFGPGTTVTNATYSGWSQSSGIYTNGDSVAPGVTPSDEGVILSTGRASHITQSNGDPNRSTGTSTNTSGQNNNADFNAAAGANTFDASFLDIDFIPTTDFITMQFTFSSEEYPEFTGSIYNDI